MSFFPIAAGSIGDFIEMVINNQAVTGPVYSSLMRRFQDLAVRLINRLTTGKIIIVKRTTVPNPSDVTDSSSQYSATHAVNACTFGFSDVEMQNDPNIHAGDRKVYVAAKGLNDIPLKEGLVLITNVGHTIVNVEAIPADGLVSLYIIQARTAG